jgi:parallel beta-helix repeat protein
MKKVTFIFGCLSFAVLCQGRIITVDDNGPADFNNIQAAINDANDGDTIIVIPGTYKGSGNRDIDFRGKAITVCSIDPNDSNIVAATVIDCNGTESDPHRGFYFHYDEGSQSVLEGLTITNGFGTEAVIETFPQRVGGGIFCQTSNPTIRKCTVIGNTASFGGGICSNHCDPTIIDCTVEDNSASFGGGIHCRTGYPTIVNCVVAHNYADGYGGGVYLYRGWEASIDNCTVVNNSAEAGGGIYYGDSTPTVSNCVINDNTARGRPLPAPGLYGYGGGIYGYRGGCLIRNCVIAGNKSQTGAGVFFRSGGVSYGGAAIIRNCTIYGNQADTGGRDIPSRGGGVSCGESCNVQIRNSILWANSAELGAQIALRVEWDPKECNIEFSNVQGGLSVIYINDCNLVWGTANIDADPCFADPGYRNTNGTPQDPNDDFWVYGDYHLKSQAGRWDANEGRWMIDEVTSLCIDAGDPASPIGLEPFPNGGIINMGAYGGTAQASKSYFGKPPCETPFAGDINGDCKVDFKDFALMAFHWLEER